MELSPAPMPVEDIAPVVAGGEGYVVGGVSPVTDAPFMALGDNALDNPFVGVLCFDLTGIGSVEQATLTFHRGLGLGDPWSMGPLFMDHIDGGGSLDAADATDPALTEAIYELMDEPSWTLDVTAQVQADVAAGRSASSFRIRFDLTTNGDATQDIYRVIMSKHVASEQHPSLVISHFAP